MSPDEIINRAAKEIRQHTGIPPGWHGWGWEEQERRFDAVLAATIRRAIAEVVRETRAELIVAEAARTWGNSGCILESRAALSALAKLNALTENKEDKT